MEYRPIAMKVFIVILSVALLQGITLFGNESEVDPAYEYQLTGEGVDLHFKVVKDPVFPQTLLHKGFVNGHVTIELEINYDGELRDWLVTRATHREFAEAVEKVIGQWKFAPPMRNGKPISVTTAIEVKFRSSGGVFTFDISYGLVDLLMNNRGFDSRDAIKVAKVEDLDAYPEPIKTVNPIVSKKLIAQSDHTLGVFRFYIDTEGRVRLPHVDRVEGKIDIRLLEAAQDALEQWRFKPLTSKGRKVIVEVVQPFSFNSNGS